MAGKKVQLLLNRNVENLGIVGDIVKVRPGFARNFLLPQALAEKPTPTKIERLREARSAALADLANLRQAREELLGRMQNVAVTIQRSCNDQGILYGSVTQRDVSEALQAAGYDVGVRSVRLSQSIRRVGSYHVPIQFEKDLRTEVTLNVEPDRTFQEEREEMEIDDEGELVEKGAERRRGFDRGGGGFAGGRGGRGGREGREGRPNREGREGRGERGKRGEPAAPIAAETPAAATNGGEKSAKPERPSRATKTPPKP